MSQSRVLANLEVAKGGATHIVVKLRYDIGGMNYFTSQSVVRGLKLSVTPVSKTISACGRYSSTVTTAFSGISKHMKDMKRFSQKTLDTFEVPQETINELVNYVCSQNAIELKKV